MKTLTEDPGRAGKTINSLVEQLAIFSETQPDKTAVIVPDDRITYGDLYALICGFSEFLRHRGIKKGDYLICRASASVSYWVSYLGVQLAGGVFVPVEKDCTAEGMRMAAELPGKVFAVISTGNDADTASRLGCEFILISEVRAIAEKRSGKNFFVQFPDGDDIGQIIFTTGTTGKAKGVVLQHKHFSRPAFRETEIPYGADDIMLLAAPMNHVLAIGRSMSTLFRGGTLVLLDGLTDMGRFYEALVLHKVNSIMMTPSALNYIVTLCGDEFVKYAEKFSFIEIGGEKLPLRQQKELVKLLPTVRMFIIYGSTETGEACYYEFSRYGAADDRIGKPMPGTNIRFTDENRREKAASRDDPAFIVVQSDIVMKGYLGDRAATEKVKRGDSIMLSDYGYTDDEGFVCLAGRSGDVIISGGYKVSPTEVENAALETGLLSDCVCVGKKDEIFGRIVKLLVVMKEGVEFDRFSIKNYLVAHLESFKVPKIIERTDRIERNRNGKLDRKAYTE